MIFLLLFFTFFSHIEAKLFTIKVCYKGIPLENVKVSLEQDTNIIDGYTDIDGEVKFDVEDKRTFIKIYKEGYLSTGDVSTPKEIEFNLKSIKSTFKGRIYSKKEILQNQPIKIENLFTKEIFETKTNESGEFAIKNISTLQEHKISVLSEGYLPYYDHIILKNSKSNIKDIFLKKAEKTLIVKLIGKNNRYIDIEIDNTTEKSDYNGSVSFNFKHFNKDKIYIFINGKKYVRKIDTLKDISFVYITLD